jgi:hypothetical protein
MNIKMYTIVKYIHIVCDEGLKFTNKTDTSLSFSKTSGTSSD